MLESFQGPLGNVEPITNKPKGPQRVSKAEAPILENSGSPVSHAIIKNLLLAVETNKEINRRETIYPYIEAYKAQGVDLQNWYNTHRQTSGTEGVHKVFMGDQKILHSASLAEALPLLANKEGRLGDYISACVTKTAKQDDQGNTFIDLIIEVNNKWLATEAPKELQDVSSRMTFLVDVTVNQGEKFQQKLYAQKQEYLKKGEKANVKCFKTASGELGISRPRIIVAKQSNYMEKVGTSLGDCVTQVAGDKFIINSAEKFDRDYQSYFLDLMIAISENAQDNIGYMRGLAPDPKRQNLIKDYEKIVKFVEAYKKTPTKRTRTV